MLDVVGPQLPPLEDTSNFKSGRAFRDYFVVTILGIIKTVLSSAF